MIRLVDDVDSSVKAVDIGFAEVEIRRRSTRVVLRNSTKISNRAGRKTAANTYRSQEDQRLLEVAKGGDLTRGDASRDSPYKRVEVLESILFEDWLDDVCADVSLRFFAQQLLCTQEVCSES